MGFIYPNDFVRHHYFDWICGWIHGKSCLHGFYIYPNPTWPI